MLREPIERLRYRIGTNDYVRLLTYTTMAGWPLFLGIALIVIGLVIL